MADGATPFGGRTGRGVVVAVIDSGVHPTHSHIRADRLRPGAMVTPDGGVTGGDEIWMDRLGHGTAVAAAIQEKAPDAGIIPVRVFRDALKASAGALISAMRWSVAQGADIINLSLGTTNEAHRAPFAAAVDEVLAAGVAVVAAREANGAACFPGALPGVIGVEVDWDCPRDIYLSRVAEGHPAFAASGYPRPIPGVPQRRNLYGVSFAVAQMSGFAARALEDMPRTPGRSARLRDALAASGASGAPELKQE